VSICIPPLFTEVPIPSQKIAPSCICVLAVSTLLLSTTCLLYFGTVPTVWYFVVFNFSLYILDTNECKRNNGGCQQLCVNEHASFHCECKPGYRQQKDGKSCSGKIFNYGRMVQNYIFIAHVQVNQDTSGLSFQ
jgi:hypothetical protein